MNTCSIRDGQVAAVGQENRETVDLTPSCCHVKTEDKTGDIRSTNTVKESNRNHPKPGNNNKKKI